MNPLTLVKRIQNINSKEASLGISEQASWHAIYKESAYVYVGGVPFDLSEGDLLAVFAQYGEIVDVNLVRDKGTGKSKGFAFLAYEDQRSTILAVDNLNGSQILGRTIRVDHVTNYKKKEEENEEAEQKKREERGVCRAFQKGECTRGAGCRFSHNEQRAANTGWGAEDHRRSRRGDDKFESSARTEKDRGQFDCAPDGAGQDGHKLTDKAVRESRANVNERGNESHHKQSEYISRDQYDRGNEKRHFESGSRDNGDRREEKRSRRHAESESFGRETRGKDKQSVHDRDSSSRHYRGTDEDREHRSRR